MYLISVFEPQQRTHKVTDEWLYWFEKKKQHIYDEGKKNISVIQLRFANSCFVLSTIYIIYAATV